MARRKPKEKDAIELLLDQIDFGQEGLVKALTANIFDRASFQSMRSAFRFSTTK